MESSDSDNNVILRVSCTSNCIGTDQEPIQIQIQTKTQIETKTYDIPINRNIILRSGFFATSLSTCGESMVYFPTGFNDIVNLYLMCINNNTVITNYVKEYPLNKDKRNLGRLLQLCHYLDDEDLFEYPLLLIRNCYCNYVEVIQSLYSEIQRNVYLHLPYHLTPITIETDKTFFDNWLTINNNKDIIVENITYRSSLDPYTDIIKIGNSWFGSRQMTQFVTFQDDDKFGVNWVWYPPTNDNNNNNNFKQLAHSSYYINGNKHGQVKQWHQNGVLGQEVSYDNGKLHGLAIEYNSDGNKVSEVIYYYDKQHGKSKLWYDSGVLKEERSHDDNGKLHGPHTEYHAQGSKVKELNWCHGKKHGSMTEWYDNGTLQQTGEYNNGYQHGIFIEYDTQGNKRLETHYLNGSEHGLKTHYYMDGDNKQQICKTINYHHGLQHELETHYHMNDNDDDEDDDEDGECNKIGMHTYNYNNGILTDIKSYYTSGNKRSESEIKLAPGAQYANWYDDTGRKQQTRDWKHNKLCSKYKKWYNNGQLKIQCNYKKGKLDGAYDEYHNNGQHKGCLSYHDGKLDGTCSAWYVGDGDQQQQQYLHTYRLGKKHGMCINWYENGQMSREYHYDNNKKHGLCKGWYPDGRVQYCTHYVNNHVDKSK